MKTFAYTYRDASGALKKSALQAADRLDALRRIRAAGCVPVSVTEGKAAAPGAGAPWNPATWNRAARLAAAGCAVLLIAMLAVTRFSGKRTERPTLPGQPAGPRSTQPPTPSSVKSTVPASKAAKNVLDGTPAAGDVRNTTSTQQRPPPAVPGRSVEAEAALKPQQPQRPQPFTTVTEQILAMIDSVPPGVTIPPLPDLYGMENDFSRASTNTLVIYEDDHEALAKRMEAVAWSKVDLAELVKQGWKPDEVLTELVKQHNENADLRSAASLALKKVVDDESLSLMGFKTELEAVNQELGKRNLPAITLEELGLTEED